MFPESNSAAESIVWGPYVSYDDVARFEYGRRFWRIPQMRHRLLQHWLDERHPHRERFLEQRALLEEVLSSEESILELDARLRLRGTTLRCLVREIPVVFGQWFSNAEIFDVVDDQDQVIDQRPRSEVHRLGLRHRAVHVLIFNRLGEVFLQKRSMTKDTHPGVWDSSSSGHLDVGEAYDDCALREVQEELGLRLAAVPSRVLRVAACEETGQEYLWVYRAEAEGPFQLHPEEIETGAWFTSAQLSRWMRERPEEFAPAFVLIWGQLGGV